MNPIVRKLIICINATIFFTFAFLIPAKHYAKIIQMPMPTLEPTAALPLSPAGFVVNKFGQEIELIFGYSSGHVGTTSISKGELYCSIGSSASCEARSRSILFKHEFLGILWDNYIEWGPLGISYYVNENYFPSIFSMLHDQNKSVYFDIGHQNLYYIEPLVQYLIKFKYKHNIIRLRRRRVEVAESLINRNFHMDHNMPVDAIQAMSFKYKPYEGEKDKIILKMDKADFDNLNFFQRALWLVDEVELRWQKLKQTYSEMIYTDVYWESHLSNSNYTFEMAASKIAKILGYSDNSFHINLNIHEKTHITPELYNSMKAKFGMEGELYRESIQYQNAFSSSFTNWTWLQFPELPPSYNSFDFWNG